MLCESNLIKYFWMEVINTIYYVLNHILVKSILKKTPHKHWEKENQTLHISKFLDADVLYYIMVKIN